MAGKMNKEWHQSHRMPQGATLDERIAWHLEHQKHCGCRDIPAKLKEEMKKRKIKFAGHG